MSLSRSGLDPLTSFIHTSVSLLSFMKVVYGKTNSWILCIGQRACVNVRLRMLACDRKRVRKNMQILNILCSPCFYIVKILTTTTIPSLVWLDMHTHTHTYTHKMPSIFRCQAAMYLCLLNSWRMFIIEISIFYI